MAVAVAVTGCSRADRQPDRVGPAPARQVVIVAPILNYSGSTDFDPLKITDLLASELQASSTFAVVPVNLTLAALQRRGKHFVESPEDALELARELGADATLVTAITEYNPFDPPIVGVVMQWYSRPGPRYRPGDGPARSENTSSLDPVTAPRGETGSPQTVSARGRAGSVAELSAELRYGPRVQLQRVFNAADLDVVKEVQAFARQRDGHQSPFGWRRYLKSQELYVRYSFWSLIKTMETRLNRLEHATAARTETEP